MNMPTFAVGLLALVATNSSQAGCNPGDARCAMSSALADATVAEQMRLQDTDAAANTGPLTIRMTTFDGSPTTPGMWYEQPSRHIDSLAIPERSNMPRSPFDRDCGPAGCD